MTIRKFVPATFLGSAAVVLLLAGGASAQEKITPEQSEAVTQGQSGRYSLVAVDGDILRVDRQNGTVSVCREQNTSWRCNPVPLAEDAYLAEINELASEIDRLTARVKELENGANGDRQLPPGSALDRKPPENGNNDLTTGLEEADEELEKVLTFTESAMRRFFGMVRELQKDFENEGN
ncbi:hypothetical protein [Roseibium sp. SCP14]|uniref:hypothetical protein n=1 Tax=Roseibium sp. SCP14 TaxID=3141375 RepID=UPI00333566B8